MTNTTHWERANTACPRLVRSMALKCRSYAPGQPEWIRREALRHFCELIKADLQDPDAVGMYERSATSFCRYLKVSITTYSHTDKPINRLIPSVIERQLLDETLKWLSLAADRLSQQGNASPYKQMTVNQCFGLNNWEQNLVGGAGLPPAPSYSPHRDEDIKLEKVENVVGLHSLIMHKAHPALERAHDSIALTIANRENIETTKNTLQERLQGQPKKKHAKIERDFEPILNEVKEIWSNSRELAFKSLVDSHWSNMEVTAWGIAKCAHDLTVDALESLISICHRWGEYTGKVIRYLQEEPSVIPAGGHLQRLEEYHRFWIEREPILRSQIAENAAAQRAAEEAEQRRQEEASAPAAAASTAEPPSPSPRRSLKSRSSRNPPPLSSNEMPCSPRAHNVKFMRQRWVKWGPASDYVGAVSRVRRSADGVPLHIMCPPRPCIKVGSHPTFMQGRAGLHKSGVPPHFYARMRGRTIDQIRIDKNAHRHRHDMT